MGRGERERERSGFFRVQETSVVGVQGMEGTGRSRDVVGKKPGLGAL